MRKIPPNIWELAVQLGKAQSLYDDTKNEHAKTACEGIARIIDSYLEHKRKAAKK